MDIIEDANGKSVSYSMVAKYNKYEKTFKTLKDLVSIAQQSIPNS